MNTDKKNVPAVSQSAANHTYINTAGLPDVLKRLLPTENPEDWQPWDQVKEAAQSKWIIEGILARGQVGLMYGAPAAYKSFIALDIGLSIAAGIKWQNRETDQGLVVYIAAEGGDDVSVRQAAWLTHKQESRPLPFYLWHGAPLLSSDTGTARDLINQIKEATGLKQQSKYSSRNALKDIKETIKGVVDIGDMPQEEADILISQLESRYKINGDYKSPHDIKLIIIDTYAATSEGDTREHWNKYIRGIKAHMPRDCAVLIVDHATKSGDTFMGTLGKQADVDFMAAIKRKGKARALMTVKGGAGKVKSAPEFDDIGFKLLPQAVAHAGAPIIDSYGKPLASLVVAPCDVAEPEEEAEITGKPKIIYDLLDKPMSRDELRAAYMAAEKKSGIKPDTARRSFNRAIKDLLNDSKITEEDDDFKRV